MNRHDRKLLNKQMSRMAAAPRSEGAMILAILAVFFTGMAIGGFFHAYAGRPIQLAANDAAAAASPPGAPQIRQ